MLQWNQRVCLDNYAAKYANMEPCKKNALSIRQAEKYRLMEPSIKRKLSVENAEKYRLMEPNKRQELSIKEAEKYRLMEPSKRQELSVKNAEKYRLMEPSKKEELNFKNSEKYRFMEPSKKQELSVKNAEKYRLMEPSQKQELFVQNAEKYRLMEPSKKQELFLQNAEKYRLMEPNKKQELFLQNAEKYRLMDSDKKKDLIKQIVAKGKESKHKKCSTRSLDYYIEQFKRDLIREGPYHICVVCNRLLYRKTVLEFKKGKYNCNSCLFTSVTSFNGNMYICNTCHVTIKKKNKTPCQAVYNNLAVDEVPCELAALEKLEQILVSQRIVFQKIVVMPKGQQRKIRGAICNVPVSCEETCQVLPSQSAQKHYWYIPSMEAMNTYSSQSIGGPVYL